MAAVSMCAVAERARLSALRDEYVQRATRGRFSDAESKEWAAVPVQHRMAFLLLAGVDGDLPELARRDWRELPGPEREAVKAEIRSMRGTVGSVWALGGRW